MFTNFDKAIAAALAPIVAALLGSVGEAAGVETPLAAIEWAQALMVSGVSAVWVYLQSNKEA